MVRRKAGKIRWWHEIDAQRCLKEVKRSSRARGLESFLEGKREIEKELEALTSNM